MYQQDRRNRTLRYMHHCSFVSFFFYCTLQISHGVSSNQYDDAVDFCLRLSLVLLRNDPLCFHRSPLLANIYRWDTAIFSWFLYAVVIIGYAILNKREPFGSVLLSESSKEIEATSLHTLPFSSLCTRIRRLANDDTSHLLFHSQLFHSKLCIASSTDISLRERSGATMYAPREHDHQRPISPLHHHAIFLSEFAAANTG